MTCRKKMLSYQLGGKKQIDSNSAECRLEKEAILRFASWDVYMRNGNKEGFSSRTQLSFLSHQTNQPENGDRPGAHQLSKEVQIRIALGCSEHGLVELSRNMGLAKNFRALSFRRASFGCLRQYWMRSPGKLSLREKGTEQSHIS